MNWEEYHKKYYGGELESNNNLLIKLIQFYQYRISWIFRGSCRFNPSCSEYMILAIKKYGIYKGVLKGICRIIRCNPFYKGGIDYP